MDGHTDGQTDEVITIGILHLRWRGPNDFAFETILPTLHLQKDWVIYSKFSSSMSLSNFTYHCLKLASTCTCLFIASV